MTSQDQSLLWVDRLKVRIPVRGDLRTVIHDATFAIAPGEAVGLVGESGSGKSMTARAIMRLLPPRAQTSGSVSFDGQPVLSMGRAALRHLRATQIGMIYQDPRAHINPVRSNGDFLLEAMLAQGIKPAAARSRALDLLAQVGIADGGRRLRQYPHQLSGGLLQRIMIAAALAASPRLLLADEPTTALDVTTQSEVMAILGELRSDRGLAMLFITHDLDLASAVTDRMAVMYAGMIVEIGSSAGIRDAALHPYTVGLLGSRPEIGNRARIKVIPGRPVSAFEAGPGCVFTARCPYATDRCNAERPSLRPVGAQLVACHRAEELRGTITFAGPPEPAAEATAGG
ncbi:MAG TPA: ABC transporter ATP-binding protein [Streptosporangiaceae bacterium]